MPSQLRVLVDAVQDSDAITGTDRMARAVIGRLPALLPEAEFMVGVRRGSRLIAPAPGLRLHPFTGSRRAWMARGIPLAAARFRPTVTVGLQNCALPPVGGGKLVATVHDLIPFRLADEYYPETVSRLAVQAVMRWSLRRADAIRTISHFTAADLADFGGTSAPVTITPPAPDPSFTPAPPEEVTRVLARYGLPEQFLLTLGAREPRKNLAGVLAAHRTLPADVRERLPLVVVGAAWTGPSSDRSADPSILETGFVDEGDLPALYSAARVFVFLSLFEGFGLPPVEAMACGTPVVAGNGTSLPEACGGAATLVDPTDPVAVGAAIVALASDGPLRAARVAAGLARAAALSWDAVAEGYADQVRGLA